MATIKIMSVETLFTDTPHDATSYQIYNRDTNVVLAESIENRVNLVQWSNELSDGNGGHHYHLTNLGARVKMFFGADVSEWIELDPYNQDEQIILDYVVDFIVSGVGESKIETRVIKRVNYLRS